MRAPSLIAIALAAACAAGSAQAQTTRPSDINAYWTGCVVARQIAPDGSVVALDRACAAPHDTFSLFEPYQGGSRPALAGDFGESALTQASMKFVGFVSDFAQGDGRKARLEVSEKGPARTRAHYVYSVTLHVDQEAIVHMPSGYSIGLRMDPSNVPTTFTEALSMPSWRDPR